MDNFAREFEKRRSRGHTARPQIPGQMNFDLNKDFKETPYQNSNKRKAAQQSEVESEMGAANPTYDTGSLMNISNDKHHQLVATELDKILENCQGFGATEKPYVPVGINGILMPQGGTRFMNQQYSSWQGLNENSNQTPTPSHAHLLANLSPHHEHEDQIFSHVSWFSHLGHDVQFSELPPGRAAEFSISSTGLLPEIYLHTLQDLIKEVRSIYAGLVMAEKKCVEIVAQQTRCHTGFSSEQC